MDFIRQTWEVVELAVLSVLKIVNIVLMEILAFFVKKAVLLVHLEIHVLAVLSLVVLRVAKKNKFLKILLISVGVVALVIIGSFVFLKFAKAPTSG